MAKCLSLKCRGDLICALPLSVEVVFVGERSCVLPIVFAQILNRGSLCWKSCVDELVEILLCEGGDVKRCARTSKHISVFAFDPLSLTLSLTLCIDSYCSYHIPAWFVCVPHLYLTKRASYSTSTLIQRNSEELVQSPSPGIRLHSLLTLSVLH